MEYEFTYNPYGNCNTIFRIFDYDKAKAFYIDWLGFKIDGENKPDNSPIYIQISLHGIVIPLTEHHGDCSPGAQVHIENFNNLAAYHKKSWLKTTIQQPQFRQSFLESKCYL